MRGNATDFAAVVVLAMALLFWPSIRAGATEPLPPATATIHTADAADQSVRLLARKPFLSNPAAHADAPEIVFVAQQDGTQGSAGGNAQTGAGMGQMDSNGVVSGNPGASNVVVGTGWLGDYLGINRNGWRFAGLNITDANGLSGGVVPGWTANALTIVDISLDLEESMGWENGLVGGELLYYSGGPTNQNAGSVMGYNSLDIDIHHRAEIYALWYRHHFADNRLSIRIGKTITTYDFNNVVVGAALNDAAYDIAAVSSLIFTPLYLSPTQYNVVPGYFNSATGVVTTWIPIKQTYIKYGLYDGNLAAGRQVGTEGPRFNGYVLHMVETGCSWGLDKGELTGKFGVGYWAQTGVLQAASGPVDGAQGIYLFGSQRLTYEHRDVTNEGLLAYFQFAGTNSAFVDTQRYFGCGLTYIGLLPGRDDDSVGWGLAYGKMSDDPALDLGADEAILSWYYQWMVGPNCFLQPNISYIPNPADSPGIPSALPVTLRAILLF
ncbi:MAG: porin [Planctomycetota bacterium]|nr:MAG: porin [Planctomycetota bacterium]